METSFECVIVIVIMHTPRCTAVFVQRIVDDVDTLRHNLVQQVVFFCRQDPITHTLVSDHLFLLDPYQVNVVICMGAVNLKFGPKRLAHGVLCIRYPHFEVSFDTCAVGASDQCHGVCPCVFAVYADVLFAL